MPREFVIVSCQAVDLELLSVASRIHPPLANFSIASVFVKLYSIWSSISKYILAAKNFKFSFIISKNTVFI